MLDNRCCKTGQKVTIPQMKLALRKCFGLRVQEKRSNLNVLNVEGTYLYDVHFNGENGTHHWIVMHNNKYYDPYLGNGMLSNKVKRCMSRALRLCS